MKHLPSDLTNLLHGVADRTQWPVSHWLLPLNAELCLNGSFGHQRGDGTLT